MIKVLRARFQQKYRTFPFPRREPALPERFRGCPAVKGENCPPDCRHCLDACPANAVSREGNGVRLDLGRCIFCGACAECCPSGRIVFSKDYRMSVRQRPELVMGQTVAPVTPPSVTLNEQGLRLAQALAHESRRLFGRSLKLRQVSAGGCNACEADVNVLGTLTYDLSRFGIQFVASPRHADGLLVTGPVSRNMELALRKTYDAVPAPKLVIAVGACAISGGLYGDHEETCHGVEGLLPVDLYIPGCPPHPYTILDGLLRLLGRR